MFLAIQIVAAAGYLFHKIFSLISEIYSLTNKTEKRRVSLIAAWSCYLTGLPFWVVYFAAKENWIAASVEAAGAPSMALGLYLAVRNRKGKPPYWLNTMSLIAIGAGFGISFYHLGIMTLLSQWLEAGLVVGYLIGTYLQGRGNKSCYLFYTLMHICCGWLLFLQGAIWLFWQQAASLGFIIAAYYIASLKASHVQS